MIGDLAHICNRGVEKRKIFTTNMEYKRFAEDLYRFNNRSGALRFQGLDLFNAPPEQEPLVDILKWSLLPNHYHLLLHERVEGGIVEFIKRLGNGYTKYFNIKHDRGGYLFQNAAQIVAITNQPQFLYIPFYIELNPLDLSKYKWREEQFNKSLNAIMFLEQYRWSSYQDYTGKNNFPFLINKKLFFDLFDTTENQYQKEIREWLTKERLPVNLAG